MLKGLDPLLNAEVLGALRAMGHGDDLILAAEGRPRRLVGVERYAFCERARSAFAVIQTGERRFYGCFAFRKGVLPPDPEA